MKTKIIHLLNISVIVMGGMVLLLCIFWLPWMANLQTELNPEVAYLKYPVLLGIYATAISFFLALFQSLKLLKFIERKDAFSQKSVTALNVIKNCALSIAVFYVGGIVLIASQNALSPGLGLMGITIIFAALTIALFAAVLRELITSALEIKSENDLTI